MISLFISKAPNTKKNLLILNKGQKSFFFSIKCLYDLEFLSFIFFFINEDAENMNHGHVSFRSKRILVKTVKRE